MKVAPRAKILLLLLLAAACLAGCSDIDEYHKQMNVAANLEQADRELTLGHLPQARQWCDRAIALDPNSANTYLGMPRSGDTPWSGVLTTLEQHGDYPDMVAYLTPAVARPALANNWQLWADLVDAQQHLGNTPAMQQDARTELACMDKQMTTPGSSMDIGTAASFQTAKADAEWLAGEQAQADADYEKVIQTYPDQAEGAENDEAYFDALAKTDLPHALILAVRAVNSAQKNDLDDQTIAEFTDTLGWVEHQSGDDTAAVNDLETAASLAPNEGDIAFHLASVYQALGRNSDAVIEYQRALQLNPYNPDAQRQLAALTRPAAPANASTSPPTAKATPA